MKVVDIVIIGGGSAGMAAAIQAKKDGVDNILILEKEDYLGGILNQCIHNGFGLTEFKEELSGPEYMHRFSSQVEELNIPYKLNAQVIGISKDKVVTYSSKEDGVVTIQAKAIIMATGCFEREAGAIQIPGDRCAGVLTAGVAQKYLNIHGYMCGKRIVILGSGDIGLIMARRLTLEGAKVICVCEIMPYSNGLNRNIAQCLNDFEIPLYLNKTVNKVIGKNRLEKVVLTAVDENKKPILGTEEVVECDTLILSVGLIPYVSLLGAIDCKMGPTKGALVNEQMETTIDGIFSCGNCLHVHDVVDFVTDEGRLAGHNAALYIKGEQHKTELINVNPGSGVNYVIPEVLNVNPVEDVVFKFRVKEPIQDINVIIESDSKVITKTFKQVLIPSEMTMIKVNKDKLQGINKAITVRLEKRF